MVVKCNFLHFWQVIWKLNILDKVKKLTWRACYNSLFSKINLVKRQVITNGTCKIRQSYQEDVAHALYLCPKLAEF